MSNRSDAGPGGLLGLLKERWKWWVIPLIVMGLATAGLAIMGQSTELKPIRYNIPSQGE